jgi:hypothetical protein
VRRLKMPMLAQWVCLHRWKTTHSLPQEDTLHRVRYHKCLRCGLRVRTEERLAVPWSEQDFMTLVAQVFPEDTAIDVASLEAWGLPGGGLSQLNAHLVPHGWQLELVRDQGRVVGVVRRRILPEARGRVN